MNKLIYESEVIEMMNKAYVEAFTKITGSRATAVEAIGSLIIDLAQELAANPSYYTFDINVLMMTIEGYVREEMEGEKYV